MSDLNDVARIGWVIDNFDTVEPVIDESTQTIAKTNGYLDKQGQPMPILRYAKQVDSTIYVVEAAGENKWKKLHVMTAYMTKNSPVNKSQGSAVTRMPHAANGLGPTSKTPTHLPLAQQ